MTSTARALVTHLVVAAMAATIAVVVTSTRSEPSPPLAAPTASSIAAVATSAAPAVSAPPEVTRPPVTADTDLLERARLGDLAALKTLEARDAGRRMPAEALAVEAGHAALARQEAQRLADDVSAEPALLVDPAVASHVLRLALDPAVAPTLLGGLAAVDHPAVPDLLFDLAHRGEPGARLALLADDLLLGAARGRASPPLAIALDVRAARSCERVSALLPRIRELADDRVLPHLERVDERTGCGPKRADDCWACLRGGEPEQALDEARRAARERRFVAPWSAEARRAAARSAATRGSGGRAPDRPEAAPGGSAQRGSAQQRKPVE